MEKVRKHVRGESLKMLVGYQDEGEERWVKKEIVEEMAAKIGMIYIEVFQSKFEEPMSLFLEEIAA